MFFFVYIIIISEFCRIGKWGNDVWIGRGETGIWSGICGIFWGTWRGICWVEGGLGVWLGLGDGGFGVVGEIKKPLV
jgi:hypothetical protein